LNADNSHTFEEQKLLPVFDSSDLTYNLSPLQAAFLNKHL